MTTLDDLLTPKSTAIVGASNDPARIGGRPVFLLKEFGYQGVIYPVNPKYEEVQGIKAYPSLSGIPGEVDFALIAVPAKSVIDIVREAVTKRVKTVIIFSSGFSELGEEGRGMQDELAKIARESEIRIIGPNCLGLFNSAIKFYCSFSSFFERAQPNPGGLAVVSQSGAFGSHLCSLAHMRGLDMTYWITTGNECDVHVAEMIKLFAESDDVHAIFAYAESIKDGNLLIEGLETARAARKPVIFVKVGSSEIGAKAATSHTASLAGEDVVYDAVLKQFGAYRARTTEEAIDICYAARPRIYPVGKRLGIVTISGGGGILMADAATECGLEVPEMPADAQVEMKELMPFSGPRNPVDITGQFYNNMAVISKFTKLMLDRGNYDGLIGFWTSVAGSPKVSPELRKQLNEGMAGTENKLFIQSLIASQEICAEYEADGYPCFEDPTRAIAAMAALMFYGISFNAGPLNIPKVPKLPDLPNCALGEGEAKKILADFGLPMVNDTLAKTAADAARAARKAGTPVAMKIASPDILHKTDVGGVKLDVVGSEAVSAAFNEIVANAKSAKPDAKIDGVLVSPMAADGVDCILGVKIDPVFGPMVMFGLGGVFTEILKDISFRRAPVNQEVARGMIDDLKGLALFKGVRGAKPSDLNSMSDAISNLSLFAAAHADAIESIEINPIRVLPVGCIGLDALIVKRTKE
jgi:acetate---CoA ligase (ADP-forming)